MVDLILGKNCHIIDGLSIIGMSLHDIYDMTIPKHDYWNFHSLLPRKYLFIELEQGV